MRTEWDDAPVMVVESSTQPENGEDAPQLHFANLDEFVREFVVKTFRRRVGPQAKYRWAADWFRNSEAIVRLEAMWRSWERARLEPTGMADWLREVADPQLEVLLDPDGPFRSSQDSNGPDEPLPYEQPSPHLFPDERRRRA